MIYRPWTATDDIAHKFRPQLIMRRRNGLYSKRSGISRLANLESYGKRRVNPQSLRDESPVCLRYNKNDSLVDAQKRAQRFPVEMIRMIVAGANYIDKIESRRIHRARRHSHMRLVGIGVFRR